MRLYLDDYIATNVTQAEPSAVTWQVASDSGFHHIITETIENTEDISNWYAPINPTPYSHIYIRCKIHFYNGAHKGESHWYNNIIDISSDPIIIVRRNDVMVAEYQNSKRLW